MRILSICFAAALLLGCDVNVQSPSVEEPKADQKPKSAMQDIAETMSQRRALEQGRKAGEQIRQIRADQDKNLQEVEP